MRLQLAMNVDDLQKSVDFYTNMFGTEPAKIRDGYANFAIENPPLKLVLFEGGGAGGTINHLGVEVNSAEEVLAAEARMSSAGLDPTEIEETMCCYAEKTETWIQSPEGRWEWYVKQGDVEVFENTPIDGQGVCCGGEMNADSTPDPSATTAEVAAP